MFSRPTISANVRMRDQLRMLDEIGGVADDARDEDFSGGEFHVAPDFVFMLVTDVAGLDPQSQFLSLDS